MRKKWIFAVVLLIAGAAGGTLYYRSSPAEASNTLITAPVTRGDVIETVQSTGTLEAVTTVQVGTQVSGTIEALYADFNSIVKADQVVARLDASLFQTQVEQARATLVRLQAELDRAKVQVEDTELKLKRAQELSARSLIPASELETAQSNDRQAKSAVKSAEAQIVQARASLSQNQVNLDHTVIKAPIDGIVVSRNVDVGQTVAASMQAPTLFVIAKDMTQMQVSASIDESDIGRIRPGLKVTFRVDAYPETTFTGAVRQVRLQPVVSQNVVSYTTIISVPNPELKLKPGMTATVTVEVARADDVLRLPTTALRFRPTAEVFASLGQPAPPGFDGEGGGGRRGRSNAGAPAPGGQAPAAPQASAATPPASGSAPAASDAAPTTDQRAARREAGGGAAGGAGGERFADMTPEQRQQLRERMQQMSPEERAQMRARSGGQGGDRGGRGQGAAAGSADQAGRRRGGNAAPSAASAAAPVVEAPRPVIRPIWVLNNGKLERLTVNIGINNGSLTAVLGGPIQEGATVVTGVAQPQSASRAGGTANPLMPFGGRGGFQGQGGGGRGGAAAGGNRGR